MSTDNGTVVVVEDDPHIADLVDLYLRREGFRVLLAGDGEKGLEIFKHEDPWIVILDVGLPGRRDGFDVCREIRARSSVPVLFLTARDDEVDRVLGPRARCRRLPGQAVLAPGAGGPGAGDPAPHPRGPAPQEVVDGGRPRGGSAPPGGAPDGAVVALATREFDLLAFLAHNVGLALSRQQLLDGVWGADWYGDERTVDVHVAQLRKKLGPDLPLATVWGVGYRFG